MRTLAGWCVRHRRLVVLFWFFALIGSIGLVTATGTAYSNSFSFPNTESANAIKLLQSVTPQQSGDREQVVFGTSGSTRLTDTSIGFRINKMVKQLDALPNISPIVSPYDASGNLISLTNVNQPQDTVGFINVTFDKQAQYISASEAKLFVHTAVQNADPNLQVAVTGQLAEFANNQSFSSAGLGVLLALIVMLLVFGSVFAALLPIVSALFALGTAIGIIGTLSHVLKMAQFAPELVLLIGLGVGVDYALFIVTRHRQGLVAGRDTETSIVNAVNTSGRAVLFAGIIVCIALLGMFALGVSFLYGLAVAAAIGVLFTMVAALTLLPALLGFIGPKVMSRKQKKYLAENGPRIVGADSKGFWPRWADLVQKRSIVSTAGAVVVVAFLVLPFFSLRLGSADQGTDPLGTTTRQAYDLLAKGFGPGFSGPLLLVAKTDTQASQLVMKNLGTDIAEQPGVKKVVGPIVVPSPTQKGVDVSFLTVYPTSSPQDVATNNLINHLRSATIPKAVGASGVAVLVGGTTATFIDFARVLSAKLPLFIGLVVVLAFILLTIVFRSFVIPLTAAIMNLFSIGAAFGILVAVFQWGWAGSLIGLSGTSPVEAFLPVMLFAILFGLSMDYQVFLVSRMHEEYIKSGDNRIAVRNGLAATGKTITAAALIMILVFGSFIFGGQRVIKEFGIGLAGGVFVDAVFIRMAIVPSLMMLLGKSKLVVPAVARSRAAETGSGRRRPGGQAESDRPRTRRLKGLNLPH